MPNIFLSPEKLKSLSRKLQSQQIPFDKADGKLAFPDGLVPLVQEITGDLSPIAESVTSANLFSSYAGSNSILLKLSQQKRLLVNAPRLQIAPALKELLKTIPDYMQVRIIVPDIDKSKKLKHLLADNGVQCFYVEHQNSDRPPSANIRIAARSRVGSTGFEIHNADLVIFTDACMLIDEHSKGIISKSNPKHDLTRLFDPTFPTHFPPAASVLAFLGNKPPLEDMRLLWQMLSIDTIQMADDGSIIPTIYYRLVEFKHKNPPAFSSASPSTFEVLKKAIWTNDERNKFIAGLADDLANECLAAQASDLREASISQKKANSLKVLVTNFDQINEITTSLNSFKLLVWKLETFPQFVVSCDLPGSSLPAKNSIYIRFDAGVGMLDDLKPSASCLVIDVVDEGLPNLDRNAASRIRAYRHAGWIRDGKDVFLSRWNGV